MPVFSPTLLYLNVFGLLRDPALEELRDRLKGIEINKFLFTSVARPTVGKEQNITIGTLCNIQYLKESRGLPSGT